MIDSERIDPLDLPRIPFGALKSLPDACAIYFILDSEGTVLYIGKARSLRTRLKSHEKTTAFRSHSERRVAWLVLSDPALLSSIEAALIERFNPPLNVRGKPVPKEETVNFILRVTPLLDRAVSIYAGRHGLSKTEAIRLLLEADLYREGCMDEARRTLKAPVG